MKNRNIIKDEKIINNLIVKYIKRDNPPIFKLPNQNKGGLSKKMYDQIMEIFCNVDDFCLQFEKEIQAHLLNEGKTRKNRPFAMADSEVITIMTYFHLGIFRNFKHFYLYFVKTHLQSEFPTAVSYNRFVELMQKAMLTMTLYLKMTCMGECTGISFVDSTTLKVCNNPRIHNHKVFKEIAERGKGSMS